MRRKKMDLKKNLMYVRDSSRGLNIFAPDFYELYWIIQFDPVAARSFVQPNNASCISMSPASTMLNWTAYKKQQTWEYRVKLGQKEGGGATTT